MQVHFDNCDSATIQETVALFLNAEPQAMMGFQRKGDTLVFWANSDPEPDPEVI